MSPKRGVEEGYFLSRKGWLDLDNHKFAKTVEKMIAMIDAGESIPKGPMIEFLSAVAMRLHSLVAEKK
jgi:hypothetical protein